MTKLRLFILFLGLSLLFSFYLFSREVKRGFLKNTDFAVTVKIQEKIDKSSKLRLADFVGNIMEGATFFASPEFSVVVVLVISIIYFLNQKGKKRFGAILIPLMLILLVCGEIYGKNVVHHPAPPFFMIKNPTTVFPKYYINDEFSYPSGHAARALYMAISVWFIVLSSLKRRQNLKVVAIGMLVFYVILVGVSRIYLGHHWLSDILGGWLLGGGFGLLAIWSACYLVDKSS